MWPARFPACRLLVATALAGQVQACAEECRWPPEFETEPCGAPEGCYWYERYNGEIECEETGECLEDVARDARRIGITVYDGAILDVSFGFPPGCGMPTYRRNALLLPRNDEGFARAINLSPASCDDGSTIVHVVSLGRGGTPDLMCSLTLYQP